MEPNEVFWHVPAMEEWRLRAMWIRGYNYRATYFAIGERINIPIETIFCEELPNEGLDDLADTLNAGTDGGWLTVAEIIEGELPLRYVGDQLRNRPFSDWRAPGTSIDTASLYSIELATWMISKMYALTLAYTCEKMFTFNMKGGE